MASRSLAIRTYLRLAHPGVKCHPSVRFGRGVSICAFDGGRIEIGAGSMIRDRAVVEAHGGILKIGECTLIGRGSVVICTQAITIGPGSLIAEYVTIRDHDHVHGGAAGLDAQGLSSAPIDIGHDVWLAAKVTVTRGVTIAPRCVVGANSVVTRSLADRGVYVGAPARRLGPRSGDAG